MGYCELNAASDVFNACMNTIFDQKVQNLTWNHLRPDQQVVLFRSSLHVSNYRFLDVTPSQMTDTYQNACALQARITSRHDIIPLTWASQRPVYNCSIKDFFPRSLPLYPASPIITSAYYAMLNFAPSTLKVAPASSTGMFIHMYQTTRHHIQQNLISNIHRRDVITHNPNFCPALAVSEYPLTLVIHIFILYTF